MRGFIPNPMCRVAAGGALALLVGGGQLWAQAPAAVAAPAALQVSAEVLQGFDSNVFLAPAHPQTDATTQLQLSLRGSWGGPRWSFSATYTPEAMAYAHHASLDFLAQSYRQDWEYAWGPHTQVSWLTEAAHYPERAGAPQSGPGDVAAVADASQVLSLGTVLTGGNSTLSVNHQYSLRSSWTASALVSLQAFHPDASLLAGDPSTAELTSQRSQSRSGGGTVTWAHQLSEHRSLQLSAMDSELWFTDPGRHLRYANLQASLQEQFGARFTLLAGAGPSWSWVLTSGTAAAPTHWPGQSYAANASLLAQAGRGQIGVSWQHSDQTGLVPGGLTTDLLALRYSLRWGRSWAAAASLGRSRFAALPGSATLDQNSDSLYAAAQFNRRLAADWSLFASASFNGQPVLTGPAASARVRRSQFRLGITYQPGGTR